MTRVKICGVTLPDDAARVSAAGADFIGLNFWPRSKRYVDPERAPMLASVARGAGTSKLVGVFVDPDVDEVLAVTAQVDLDIIQLHGDEDPDQVQRISRAVYRPVWKAVPVGSRRDIERLDVWPVEAILLDAPTPGRGGAGAKFDWNLAREARERFPRMQVVLAGGLRPDNVADAIATVDPWAVDVASGVEAGPGIKDAAKLDAFLAATRAPR
ncbi:MAG: phosphoribosylanthranilate isomerase [Kofleriaceae bacterium]|nr:phosphoribosylanthranilate isomerase [Kofleriaceae bacterium]